MSFFFFQAEDGIRDSSVTGVQTCALPIYSIEGTGEGAISAGRDRSPLATLAIGAGAYLLLAAVVDALVIRVPDGNPHLQTALIALLGLAFVAAAEGFLALIRVIPQPEMLGWPFCAAPAASVAYSLAYGHRLFVNYWFYDDWGYLVPFPFDNAFSTLPL